MTGRERMECALSHRQADRVPIYIWIFNQPGVIDEINGKYGGIDAFHDLLDVDLLQAFPAGGMLDGRLKAELSTERDPTFGQVLTVEQALEIPLNDPDNEAIYEPIKRAVEHDQGRHGRGIFVQTPGVFEATNPFLGLQNHLMELALQPEQCARLYDRIADWSCSYIDHCAELGVDCIHVSDDWGMQNGLLFRKESWLQYIRPATAKIAARAKAHGKWLSLHSDGDITSVLDEVDELGFDVIHPCQESAGMNQAEIKQRYRGRLALYGGLDVQSTLNRLPVPEVKDEVRRVMRALKPGGGYIFCTSHMVQPGTPIDDVIEVYETVREEAVY